MVQVHHDEGVANRIDPESCAVVREGKATLKSHRNAYEYRALVQLAEVLPADVEVLIVADRGIGS